MEKMIEKTNENIHAKHRQRMKAKFLKTGIDSFAEHEILELLLYYSIPQADTNPTAHALIKKFKSLRGVFNASFENLKTVEGVGDHTATLIKLFPAIMTAYNKQNTELIKNIPSQRVAKEFVSELFKCSDTEEVFVICLNANNDVLDTKKIAKGGTNKVDVDIRELTRHVFKNDCDRIIVAHNHLTMSAKPSDDDIVMTHKLFNSCVLNDIDILDHIIYSPYGCFSFAEHDLLKQIKDDVLDILKFNRSSPDYRRFYTSTANYLIVDDDQN